MDFEVAEGRFKKNLEAFAASGYRFSGDYTLYKESQQQGFQGYLDGLSKGKTHGYIELPTGVGKTALFIALIKNYLDAANGGENAPRVLIAVPTEKLAVQTAQALAKFMPDIAKTLEADGDAGQEIDWEKSDIGMQYSKMKHAHKNPKVLITTYQSLARDTVNKTYAPEDYGFVIYDEGHVITAPSFGKAVDTFHASIQLAVTATPEYSEQKTVAARLPHRYYQLPLAEAINRGDLCNVRPAIIKTGYKIDEGLFQRFIDAQNGRVLSTNQLEHLLNQEARNKSVVETYLRGADPDSEERYFGQNGMVFCTGIKHADALAAQFGKALEHGDGRALKNWLDQEGIELIAPVHGNIKGAWLKKGLLPDAPADSREYQGKKEWYSEQEIFDLHAKGKILLLASVAKLKVGYDSPRDSLLFDLADRYSKVDATQIDGRAFRLDPEDPEKTATVFNLMDENTMALYEKYPKMIPIYCAEVIEGAEFRLPAKRVKAHIRFKEPPPGMEKSLQEAGFDVITNVNVTRTISRNYKAKREKAIVGAPEKTDDWLGINDMAALTGRHAGKIIGPLYHKLQPAWEEAKAKNLPQFSAEGITLLTEQAGLFRRSGVKTTFCLHRDTASVFALPAPKTDGWWGAGDMTQHMNSSNSAIGPKYKALQSAWEQAKAQGHPTFEAEGMEFSTEQGGMFRAGTLTVFCLRKDAASRFQATPEKTADWLGSAEMARLVGRGDFVKPAHKALQEAWKQATAEGKTEFSAHGITLRTDQAGMFRAGNRDFFFLHKDTAPLFADATAQKTETWLGVNDMALSAKRHGTFISPVYKALQPAWEQAIAKGKSEFSAQGVTLRTDQAGMFRTACGTVFCLHRDAVSQFADKMPKKSEAWLSLTEMTRETRRSGKHMSRQYASLKSAWEKAVEAGEPNFTAEGLTLPVDKAGMFRGGTKAAFCLHQDVIPEVKAALSAGKSMSFAESVGRASGPRSLTPGSNHLERNGRARGG